MKRTLIITLALALALGTTAMADPVEPVPTEVETSADVSAEVAEGQAQDAPAETEAEKTSVNLEDAIKALQDARADACMESLKAELDGYVAAGKLTQEQADTILKQFSTKAQGQDPEHNRRGGQRDGRQSGRQGGQMPGNQMPQQGGQMPGNRNHR